MTSPLVRIIKQGMAQGLPPLALAHRIEKEFNMSPQQLQPLESKYNGFDYILTFNHKADETPTVKHTTTPDHAIRMARMVIAQYPQATWFIVRRSDGVCLAQSL
jgi:hypothetical protein